MKAFFYNNNVLAFFSDDLLNYYQRDNYIDLDETRNNFNYNNMQCTMLDKHLLCSFIELELYSTGFTAGLSTASKQVRLLLRDLNGKSCWDASYLLKELNSKGSDKFGNFVYESNKMQNQSNLLDSMLPMKLVKCVRQTMRHRFPFELPTHKDLEIDCDQLDDVSYFVYSKIVSFYY